MAKLKIKPRAELGSVKFHTIGETAFWLTPANRIFAIPPDGRVLFPTLSGGIIHFDDHNYEPSAEITTWLVSTIRKQREIRNGWLSREEDEIAWDYS